MPPGHLRKLKGATVTATVPQRLQKIVSLIPELGPTTRVLDVGSGTGCLIPHLQARGVGDITAVDLSACMLEQLTSRFPTPSVCGNDPGRPTTGWLAALATNCVWMCAPFHKAGVLYSAKDSLLTPINIQLYRTSPKKKLTEGQACWIERRVPALCPCLPVASCCQPGVRTWCGDFMQLPAFMGSANTVCMNAVFGNLPNPREALLKAALLLQPGGYVLISHPMGRAWHRDLHKAEPAMVPHELPDKEQLQELTRDLPLELVEYTDEEQLYAAVLQVGPRNSTTCTAYAACIFVVVQSFPTAGTRTFSQDDFHSLVLWSQVMHVLLGTACLPAGTTWLPICSCTLGT